MLRAMVSRLLCSSFSLRSHPHRFGYFACIFDNFTQSFNSGNQFQQPQPETRDMAILQERKGTTMQW